MHFHFISVSNIGVAFRGRLMCVSWQFCWLSHVRSSRVVCCGVKRSVILMWTSYRTVLLPNERIYVTLCELWSALQWHWLLKCVAYRDVTRLLAYLDRNWWCGRILTLWPEHLVANFARNCQPCSKTATSSDPVFLLCVDGLFDMIGGYRVINH